MKTVNLPASLQGVLWSKSVDLLDLEKDKIYIIHQILSYGSLQQIRWLFRVYSSSEIINVFLRFPKKIYQPAIFNFVKVFVLGLKEKTLSEEKYVKTVF